MTTVNPRNTPPREKAQAPFLELQTVNKPLRKSPPRISPHCKHIDFCHLSPHWRFIALNEMDTQKTCPGFNLEEGIAEENENIVID